jgi:lipase
MPAYQTFSLAVDGGELHGGMWGKAGPVVLCSHGITANHMSFELLADQLGETFRVVAPDHRGRGRSNRVAGPWGMTAHARDMVAVLDHLGLPKADIFVGQSMGGFVGAVFGAQSPQRLGQLLLVDGGLPLIESLPRWIPVGPIVNLIIGPSVKRLSMRFASREAYFDYWRPHPALAGSWSPHLERFLGYDLVGDAPDLRSSVSREAVMGDARTQLGNTVIPDALRALRGPVRLLRAPRGTLNGRPLYRESLVQRWSKQIEGFSATTIPDVNHYTICLSAHGASAIAEEIRRMA